MVFQRTEVFDPVAGVEVGDGAVFGHQDFVLGLVDVAADHAVVAVLQGIFGGDLLKVADVFDRGFDAVFDLFGERHLFAPQALQAPVDEVVDPDEEVVTRAADLCQPLGALYAGIKYVAVEKPDFFAVGGFDHKPVLQVEIAEAGVGKLAQQLVVIAREVIDRHVAGDDLDDLLDDLHVLLGPVALAKLPNVDDVAIEDQRARLNAAQVAHQFAGAAAIGAEVYIRNYYDIDFPFTHIAENFRQ